MLFSILKMIFFSFLLLRVLNVDSTTPQTTLSALDQSRMHSPSEDSFFFSVLSFFFVYASIFCHTIDQYTCIIKLVVLANPLRMIEETCSSFSSSWTAYFHRASSLQILSLIWFWWYFLFFSIFIIWCRRISLNRKLYRYYILGTQDTPSFSIDNNRQCSINELTRASMKCEWNIGKNLPSQFFIFLSPDR